MHADGPRAHCCARGALETAARVFSRGWSRMSACMVPQRCPSAQIAAGNALRTVYVAWDTTTMHENEKIEAVLWGAAGRLALLSLAAYSPWLNPIEMLWRQFRRQVTHGERFDAVGDLLTVIQVFLERYHHCAGTVRCITGAHPT
jgi:DDE superfamily endonuclease